MKRVTPPWALAVSLCFLCVHSANAQFFVNCEGNDSVRELKQSIIAHNEHMYRLRRKFPEYWYFQGKVPKEVLQQGTLEDVETFLGKLGDRNTAILFYGHDHPKFCSWLIWSNSNQGNGKLPISTPAGVRRENGLRVLQDVQTVTTDDLFSLESLRLAIRGRGVGAESTAMRSAEAVAALSKASNLLFAAKIANTLRMLETDTLIVVPITIKEKDEQFASIGTVPFAALQLGADPLVYRMSVMVAPGFYAFTAEPGKARRVFREAVIVGDPDGTLHGARREAESISAALGFEPLIGADATIQNVTRKLRSQQSTDLLHLATHGIADPDNPLDESYLEMHSGEKWTARQISRVKLRSQPLVIMSACQTGLGMDFGVGTIGLARAWQWAGASAVIMSLWDVDDAATRDLMEDFLELSLRFPVDKALQRAMQAARHEHPNPALWAGFSVFGMPEVRADCPESENLN